MDRTTLSAVAGLSLCAALTAPSALAHDGGRNEREAIPVVVDGAGLSIEQTGLLDTDKTENLRLPSGGERMGPGTNVRMGGAPLPATVFAVYGRMFREVPGPFAVAFDDISLVVGDGVGDKKDLPLLRAGVALDSTCETMGEVLGDSGFVERVDERMRIRKSGGRAVIEFPTPPLRVCLIFPPVSQGTPIALRVGSSQVKFKFGTTTAAEPSTPDQAASSAGPVGSRPAWKVKVAGVRSPPKVAFDGTFGQKQTPEAGKRWLEVTAQFKNSEAFGVPVEDIRLVDGAGKQWSLVALRLGPGPFMRAEGLQSLHLLKTGTNKMPFLFATPPGAKGLRLQVGGAPSVRLPEASR